ncbi:MAG: uroporphyrinogen-III synthase [Gammaproteobacteria bacterium]|nr:uroporphyrinogen-III synthase [Pseudomonadales bacterium]MCP5348863.1 uroporphyrinogen-III synthase [Pseudomonadales bacterium]
MPIKIPVASSLKGTTVALPESRQLDVLAALFERRGSTVIRIPLVTILDSPDRQAVESWLSEFIADPPDYLIILTGEGIRRLAGFARRAGCLEGFTQVLSVTIKVCRGPKPGRALKELGLDPDLQGKQPTTAGIIATLDALQLRDARVGVQLYGEDPNVQLIDYLTARQAGISTVAPYVYAAESDTQRVTQLIGQLLAGEIDLIAFTSKPQFGRLLSVARTAGQEPELLRGLAQTLVAAVGPVVAAQLAGQGVRVDITPRGSYFMKPMVREIERYLARES